MDGWMEGPKLDERVDGWSGWWTEGVYVWVGGWVDGRGGRANKSTNNKRLIFITEGVQPAQADIFT